MHPTPPRSISRFATLAIAVVWCLLTAVSGYVHYELWGHVRTTEEIGLPLLIASNMLHLLTGPAWGMLRVITGDWGSSGLSYMLLADGLGWAGWILCVVVLIRLRRWILSRPAPAASKSEPALAPAGADRRRFIIDGSLAVAGVGVAGLSVRAAAVDAWRLTTASYTVPIAGLPAGLDGLRFVQLSDPHLGPRVPAAFLKEAIDRALALRPDVFLLTGDYVHQGRGFIAPAASILAPLVQSGIPVAGVLGNHDWYADGRSMSLALQHIGVRMLDNGRTFLDADTRRFTDERGAAPGRSLCLAGLGDLMTDFISVRLAVGGVDPEVPRIVLAHNPDTAEHPQCVGDSCATGSLSTSRATGSLPASAPRIDLMISGHTHGGQVRLPFLGTPFIPSRFGQKYAGGLVKGPAFPVLISRGIGMSLLPVRLGVPPEIVEITITRA